MTILCLASYEKGHRFLAECKRLGATVLLVTSLSLKDKARWPEGIDEIFYMPDNEHQWDRAHLVSAVSHLARTHVFDRIVGLDDFDVETAAMLREHMRVPGSGDSTARYYRDKLAMRVKARESGPEFSIAVPDFIQILNYDRLREFMNRVPAPWVLKPRSMAGAIGIKKVHSQEELWRLIDKLGDQQSHYLLEHFVPGDIFHVDSVVFDREIRFAIASGYGRPPMEVAQEGGVFTSRILDRESPLAKELYRRQCSRDGVLRPRGARRLPHEFVAKVDGHIYFLETSARVGGAHISDLIEAATGLPLGRVGQTRTGRNRRRLPHSAAPPRLCGPARLPRAPAASRPLRLQRSRNRLAHGGGVSRRSHRALTLARPRRRTPRRLYRAAKHDSGLSRPRKTGPRTD